MEGYSREQVLLHAVGKDGGVQQRTGTAARRRERMEGYSREQVLQHAVGRDWKSEPRLEFSRSGRKHRIAP